MEEIHLVRTFVPILWYDGLKWFWNHKHLGKLSCNFYIKVPWRRSKPFNQDNFDCIFANLCCLRCGYAARFISPAQNRLKIAAFDWQCYLLCCYILITISDKLYHFLFLLQLFSWNRIRYHLLFARAFSMVIFLAYSSDLCWYNFKLL